jgi:hypothetical protein
MNAAPAGLLARKVRSAAHYTIPARVGKLVAWPYAVITPPDPRSMRPEKGNGVDKRRRLVLPLNLGVLPRISQYFPQLCNPKDSRTTLVTTRLYGPLDLPASR